jgi:hypothetical protein
MATSNQLGGHPHHRRQGAARVDGDHEEPAGGRCFPRWRHPSTSLVPARRASVGGSTTSGFLRSFENHGVRRVRRVRRCMVSPRCTGGSALVSGDAAPSLRLAEHLRHSACLKGRAAGRLSAQPSRPRGARVRERSLCGALEPLSRKGQEGVRLNPLTRSGGANLSGRAAGRTRT